MAGLDVQLEEQRTLGGETTDLRWSLLYKVAGMAALLTVAFIPIQIAVFLALPPPGYEPTSAVVAGWLALLHNHRFLGLIDMDLFLIIQEVLAVPMVLALYLALKRANESIMALATVLSLVGIVTFFGSNTTFSMLSLSRQYAAATTEAQRSMCIAAGQVMIALYSGTAFQVSYILGSATIVMICAVMLRSSVFSRTTAYAGMAASVIGLGLYVPRVGIYISVASVPFWAIWNLLIARKFFQLGRHVARSEANDAGEADDADDAYRGHLTR